MGGLASMSCRVVAIAHTAVTRGAGRLRYRPIAVANRGLLTLVVPARWHEYGRLLRAEPAEPALDIRVLPVHLTAGGPAKWYLHFYPGLGRLLRELQPSVIHLWEEPWGLVALQAIMLRALVVPRAAIVLETEQNILRRLPYPFNWVKRFALSRTDALVVRSAEALAVARATGYSGPAVTVEYCVDAAIFHPRGRAEARRALAGAGLLLGYAGRITEAKGLARVIAAVARCRAEVTLLMLGDGPDIGGLQTQARALGVADRVRFLPPRPGEGVAAFFRGIDVLVLFSQTTRTWKEQFGRVIIEAQACGTPVIGSDSGAIPSVVANGGWILGEDDTEGLAALLDRLAADSADIAAKAAAGLAEAAGRFTPEKVAGDLCDAYVCAAERRRGRRCKSGNGGVLRPEVGS
jgi:glycosyltransferase involved in cell wall biosynthesis